MLSESILRRLEQRMEQLAELFLEQADPEEWRDLSDAQKRGDTYWLKKNASQTLGIMVRIQSLINMHMRVGGGTAMPNSPAAVPIPGEDEGDESTALAQAAEADALRIIDRVQKSRK